jgi:pimeloyl-ACP methyl ester carboxylesterase
VFVRRFAIGCLLLAVSAACAQLPKSSTPSEPNPHYFLYQDRIRIYYEDVGQGEPLVLLHGFGETSLTWSGVTPELARRHRVIAIDLKGAGYSDKPADGRYRLADQAAIVRALAEHLGFERVTLVGHSMGGLVALMAALQWQEAERNPLARLVLLDSAGLSTRLPRLISMLRLPVIGPLMLHLANPDLLARQVLGKNYLDPAQVPEALVQAYADAMRSPGARRAMIAMTRQLIPEDAATLATRYAALTVPVLLVHCVHDRVIPFSQAERLQRALPNARLAPLDGCGHSPQEETPATTVRAILSFLERR